MLKYILVGIGSGILFGMMDGVINANPLAQRLHEFFKPIARSSVNAPAGIVIDLIYGLVMAGLFLLLYRSLPGASGWIKGISFGLLAWFFRVLMNAASQWMMFKVPGDTLAYSVLTGLLEMLVIGVLYGLALRPAN
jgi:Family of unknown function (DUF6789)